MSDEQLLVTLGVQDKGANKQIQALSKELRYLDKEYKATAKGSKGFEQSQEGLKTKLGTLEKKYDVQKLKLEAYNKKLNESKEKVAKKEQELEKLKKAEGDNTKAIEKAEKQLETYKTQMNNAAKEISLTEIEMKNLKSEISETGDKLRNIPVEEFNKKLKDLDENYNLITKATKGYENSLDGLNNKQVHLQQKYDLVNSKLAEQKRIMNESSNKVKEKKKELEALKQAEGDNTKAIEEASKELTVYQSKLKSATAEVNKTELELKGLNNELENHEKKLNDFKVEEYKRSMQSISDTAQTVSDRFKDTGQMMSSAGGSLMKLSAPLIAFNGYALKATMDFESGMAEVQSISGATAKDLEKLKEKAKEMGVETKFSASQSAEAMKYMAMAGWKTTDMINGISGVMDLAAASGEDLALVSDILTDGLTAFNMTAADSGRFADVLASASSNANTNVAMLGESFKYVAPVAGAMKYSVEDTALALGLMANAGIKASQSGTALRTSITNMVKPTDSMAAVMEKYNISLQNSDGTQKSLMQVIEMLRNRFRGLDEATKASAAATLFGKEAMSGMLAIINAAPSDFNKLRDAIANSNGTAKEMAEIMNKTARGQITLLKSKLEGLGIQIGEKLLPHVNDLVDELGELIDWFGSLDDETQKTIIQMGLLTFAGGGTLKMIGSVSQGVGSLVGAYSKLASKSADNADKMKVLSKSAGGASKGVGLLLSSFRSLNPVTIGVTAGIAGLSAGMAVYKTHNDLMNNTILDTTDNMNALEKAVAKFTGINVKSKEELIEMGLVYKDFSDNISKEFQDKVIESTERVHEFNMKLEEINFDGVIDEKEANDLKNRVTDMCDGVINTIKQKQEESQKSMKEFFLRDGDLHENEKTILESLDRISKTNIEEVTKLKGEILEIEQQALNNKRELSDEEVRLIQEKNNRIAQIELESLGKSHEEIVYAQTEFQNRLNNISLEDASKLMQEKAKLRDDEYNKIKDYYDTKINLLQENLTKANDTERAAFENEIKVLEGERDKKLQTNNELYDGYLNTIAEKYPYIIGEINKYNGQILQEEDHKAQERLAKLQSQYDNMNSITESGNYIMYNKTSKTWDAVAVTIDEKTGEIIGIYSDFTQKSGGYNKQVADSTYELSKNFKTSSIDINKALNDMVNSSNLTSEEIKNNNKNIVNSLKDVKENADGTREGILELNGEKIKIQTDTSGAIRNLDEIKRKVNDLDGKEVHVSVWTKIKNALGFKEYAKGTNYASSGVNLVGEKGFEIVEQGSKVGLVGLDGPEFRIFRGGEKVIPHNRSVEMLKSINRDVITSGGYFSPNSIQSRELISNVTNNYNNNVYSSNTNINNSQSGFNTDSVNQAINLIAEALLSKINNANINLNADLNVLANQLTPGIKNNITREQKSRDLVIGKVR